MILVLSDSPNDDLVDNRKSNSVWQHGATSPYNQENISPSPFIELVNFHFIFAFVAEKRIPEKNSNVEKSLTLPSTELVNL
jgi:hypothetical protein